MTNVCAAVTGRPRCIRLHEYLKPETAPGAAVMRLQYYRSSGTDNLNTPTEV